MKRQWRRRQKNAGTWRTPKYGLKLKGSGSIAIASHAQIQINKEHIEKSNVFSFPTLSSKFLVCGVKVLRATRSYQRYL